MMNTARVTLCLCSFSLATSGMCCVAQALDVALNLRYTDPADPSEGGTWSLVAISDDPNSTGLTRLTVRLTDMPPSGTVDSSIGQDINGGGLQIGTFGSETEFIYGQDLDPNSLVLNVGLIGGPSDQGADPLNDPEWDNASVIATGAISDLTPRPAFTSAAGIIRLSDSSFVQAVVGLINVRGDSECGLGLDPGTCLEKCDLNRDGFCGPADLGLLGINWDPTGMTNGWDNGDLNDDGAVGPTDLGLIGINWSPTGLTVVPEPSGLILLTIASVGFISRRRRETKTAF